MTSYNSQVCKDEKTFRIQYETNIEENYKHIENEIRKQIDKKKSEDK